MVGPNEYIKTLTAPIPLYLCRFLADLIEALQQQGWWYDAPWPCGSQIACSQSMAAQLRG